MIEISYKPSQCLKNRWVVSQNLTKQSFFQSKITNSVKVLFKCCYYLNIGKLIASVKKTTELDSDPHRTFLEVVCWSEEGRNKPGSISVEM